MDFYDERVTHRNLGKGTIVAFKEGYITIVFDGNEEEKTFQYPKTIGTFIELENEELNKLAKAERLKALEQEEHQKKLRQDKMEEDRLIRQAKARKLGKKVIPESNIAFKFNFCDGGKDNNIGFNGICTERILDYNAKKGTGCKQASSKCHQHYTGKLQREQLEKDYHSGECICHESRFVTEWKAYAGVYQTGNNKGKTKKFKDVKLNKLAVLTTKRPDQQEEGRYIFAVFLIAKHFEGEGYEEGYVAAHDKYRIALTEAESEALHFWRYYANINNPEKPAFSTGLNRYLDDVQAAQILRAIAKLKRGTDEEKLAKEFFKYYCRMNGINSDEIPSPTGALKRSQN